MRLLLESPNCNAFAGSNGAVGYGWVTNLARDHEVHVVTYGDTWDRGGAPDVPNVHVIRIKPSRVARLGTMSDFVVQAARHRDQIIDRVLPDVVHSIEPGGWGGPRPMATTRVPYLLGPVAGGAVEHPRAFSAQVLKALPVTPVRSLFSGGPKRFAVRMWNEALFGNIPTTRMLGHAAMRKARRILLATSVTRGAIPASCEEKVRRIPLMGIDLETFRPGPKPATGPITVLYAGRIAIIKCLHLLIEAVAKTGAVLRIAGAASPGEEWYERHCRERADALGVTDRITWLGDVPRGALADEYARADLFCMLSLWDTYGLTYVESMACGTPVVGLAAGGAPEIITPDVGWLVQPTTPAGAVEQLASRIEADRDELRRMGERARAHAEQTFYWPRLVQRMNAFYEEIL
jgi:glycosyltransferase involved in cell wall biosynthesis